MHLRISREAKTLILYRWDKTRKWAEVSRDRARPQRQQLTDAPGQD